MLFFCNNEWKLGDHQLVPPIFDKKNNCNANRLLGILFLNYNEYIPLKDKESFVLS